MSSYILSIYQLLWYTVVDRVALLDKVSLPVDVSNFVVSAKGPLCNRQYEFLYHYTGNGKIVPCTLLSFLSSFYEP